MTDEACFIPTFEIIGGDFQKAGRVSTEIKRFLNEMGLSPQLVRKVSIAVYETEMNVVCHAIRGTMEVKICPDRVEVTCKDEGKGIEDVEKAMQEGFSTANEQIREMGFGAGMGLPNMKKNMDVLEIETKVGEGTTVHMVRYLE